MPEDLDSSSSRAPEDRAPEEQTRGLVHQIAEFAKLIYVEQRLPALILTLILASSGTVITFSSSSGEVKLFAWAAVVSTVLFFTFFVLPGQDQKLQKIKADKKRLEESCSTLTDTCSRYSEKIDQVRAQISSRAKESFAQLDEIGNKLGNIQSHVKEFLISETERSDEEISQLDTKVTRLLAYVEQKKQEMGGLQDRIEGAEGMFDTSFDASKLFSDYRDDADHRPNTSK
ncbi:MAG: hypothetical protein AAF716_04545 [Cyanobacteria bacterium P01_D01_bin.1]